jgi:hypothetical protein
MDDDATRLGDLEELVRSVHKEVCSLKQEVQQIWRERIEEYEAQTREYVEFMRSRREGDAAQIHAYLDALDLQQEQNAKAKKRYDRAWMLTLALDAWFLYVSFVVLNWWHQRLVRQCTCFSARHGQASRPWFAVVSDYSGGLSMATKPACSKIVASERRTGRSRGLPKRPAEDRQGYR